MIRGQPRKANDIIKDPQKNVFKVVPIDPRKLIVFSSFEEFERAAENLMRYRGWHLEGRD